jgi:hypothetical protein
MQQKKWKHISKECIACDEVSEPAGLRRSPSAALPSLSFSFFLDF